MSSIIQWNMRGLRANYNELEILIGTFRPVAFCLQELLIPECYIFQNRQYTLIKKLPSIHSNARPAGGAGILIRRDIPFSTLTLDSTLQAVACRISLIEPITLCSIYLPPTSSWSYMDLLSLVSSLPSPVILMGDFNSHSTLWGCSSTNQKGLEIETFLLQSNLCLLNNKSPTYLHPATGSSSSLDLAFCDPSLYLDFNWSVHNDLCGSDHYPTVLSKPVATVVGDQRRWKLPKADWVVFRDLCSSSLSPTALLETSDKVKKFTSTLIEIADNSIPKTSGRRNAKQKPWFNEDCKSAIRNRKQALKEFLSNPVQSNLETLRVTKATARRTIKTAKRANWTSYISKLNSSTPAKKVWDMVRKISGKAQPSAIHHLVVDNIKIENPQQIANTIASTVSFNSSQEQYSQKFQKFKYHQEKHPVKFQSDESESYNQLFSLIELQDAIGQAHDTAVGPDEIHYQMLKHLPEVSVISLLEIFNNIWETGSFPSDWSEAIIIPFPKPEKDHSKPENYRPIALTSCLCKTFERMVNNRLTWFLESNDVLTELQ